MALFVHLASEKDCEAIRRSGVKPRRILEGVLDGFERIVFAIPVTNDCHRAL